MAHEIDGINAVYVGKKAWHRIGAEIPKGETFAKELRAVRDVMPVLFSEYDEYEAFVITSDPKFVGGAAYTVKNGGKAKPCRIAPVPDVKAIVRRQDGRIMRRTVGADSFCWRRVSSRAEATVVGNEDSRYLFMAVCFTYALPDVGYFNRRHEAIHPSA